MPRQPAARQSDQALYPASQPTPTYSPTQTLTNSIWNPMMGAWSTPGQFSGTPTPGSSGSVADQIWGQFNSPIFGPSGSVTGTPSNPAAVAAAQNPGRGAIPTSGVMPGGSGALSPTNTSQPSITYAGFGMGGIPGGGFGAYGYTPPASTNYGTNMQPGQGIYGSPGGMWNQQPYGDPYGYG